jgi:hypothetical protein
VPTNSLPELSSTKEDQPNVPAVAPFFRNWLALPAPLGNTSVFDPATAGASISV